MDNTALTDIHLRDLVTSVNLTSEEIESLIEDLADGDILITSRSQNEHIHPFQTDENVTKYVNVGTLPGDYGCENQPPLDFYVPSPLHHNLPQNEFTCHMCTRCSAQFSVKEALNMHTCAIIGRTQDALKNSSAEHVSFESYSISRYFDDSPSGNDIAELLRCLRLQILQDMSVGLKLFRRIGIRFSFDCVFHNETNSQDGEERVIESNVHKVLGETQLEKTLGILSEESKRSIHLRFDGDPKCIFVGIHCFRVFILKYKSMCAGTYLPLPQLLMKRKEIFINVDNSKRTFENEVLTPCQQTFKNEEDLNSSFLFAVAAGIKRAKYCTESMRTYRRVIKTLNLTGIIMPMTLDQLPKFERQNPHLEINVFGFYDTGISEATHPELFPQNYRGNGDGADERLKKSMTRCAARDRIITKHTFPLYISSGSELSRKQPAVHGANRKSKKREITKIDLILIIQKQEEAGTEGSVNILEHFVLCKDIGALFRYGNRCKSYLCRYCLQRFKKPWVHADHVLICESSNKQVHKQFASFLVK